MRDGSSGLDASQRPMTRRTLLRLGAVAGLSALAGCRPNAGSATASPPPTNGPSAGMARSADLTAALVRRGADAEQSLISAYDEAIAGHPELAALLVPLRADHVAHLTGLVPGATPSPSSGTATGSASGSLPGSAPGSALGSTSGSAPGSGSDSASDSGPAAAGSAAPEKVTARLADLERAAAAARVDDLMTTPDGAGSLARVLASIGGCEASHAALLASAVAR